MPKRSAFPNRYSFAALPEPTVERNGQRVSLFDALHDEVTFIDVKPNRGDALSILGLAREVAAVTRSPVRWASPNAFRKRPSISSRRTAAW